MTEFSASDDVSPLVELARHKRVLVSMGAGGVGKTTIAASLGLLGAQQRRRTLVMTIDPARRLAVSLGLAPLTHEPTEVPAEKLAAVGVPAGLLQAMVLDQKRTFDEVIARHAPDSRTRERIMRNKLYRELSTRLAGGQEYAAIEKLYDAFTSSECDLLVLDTPPTVNALDFLDAPRKMVALLDGPAVRLFVRSYEQVGRFSFKFLSFGAAYAFKRLARFVGGDFLDDVAEFFADLHTMLDGFRQRAADVLTLLQREDVGFVVVTTPHGPAVDDALALTRRLREHGVEPSAYVINRVHPNRLHQLEEPQVVAALRRVDLTEAQAMALAPLLLRSQGQMAALGSADALQIQRLRAQCGEHRLYIELPLLPADVHDVSRLAQMASLLAAPSNGGFSGL